MPTPFRNAGDVEAVGAAIKGATFDFTAGGAIAGSVTVGGTMAVTGSVDTGEVKVASRQMLRIVADVVQVGGTTGEITLANNGIVDLFSMPNGGLLIVQSSTEGLTAWFSIGASGTCTLVSDPSAAFSHTSGTAVKANVYVSGGKVKLENKRGGTASYRATLVGALANVM
jgi:hypothetical protein